MEHDERHIWLREIARINKEINEARKTRLSEARSTMRAVSDIRPPGVYPGHRRAARRAALASPTRASPASSDSRRAVRSTSRAALRAGTSSSTSTASLERGLSGALRRGLLPQRRHSPATSCASRIGRKRGRGGRARARRRAPSASSRTAGTSRPARARAQRRALGQRIWVRFRRPPRRKHAAHARPRGRRRARRASTRRAASSAARWCASTIARTPTTSCSPRSTIARSAGRRRRRSCAAIAPPGPTYLEVLEFEVLRVAQGSPRGVPRAAAVAAVAPLRAAHRQRASRS